MAAQMTGALLWGRAAFRGEVHSLILEEGKYFPSGWWGVVVGEGHVEA